MLWSRNRPGEFYATGGRALFVLGDASAFFRSEPPTYSFLVRLWSRLLFLFGGVTWKASSGEEGRSALLNFLCPEGRRA